MTKTQLRHFYIQKRSSLSEAEYTSLSNQLCINFFNAVDLSTVKVLHIFLPIKKNKEPDTWLIINRIKNEFPKIKFVVPRIKIQTMELENILIENDHQVIENSWGIPEPNFGTIVPPSDIDMVLVPLLAFDDTGHRVGYGKGFYDRFLAQCRKGCAKIGLSFFPPILKIEDVDKNDIKLNITIGASDIYNHDSYGL